MYTSAEWAGCKPPTPATQVGRGCVAPAQARPTGRLPWCQIMPLSALSEPARRAVSLLAHHCRTVGRSLTLTEFQRMTGCDDAGLNGICSELSVLGYIQVVDYPPHPLPGYRGPLEYGSRELAAVVAWHNMVQRLVEILPPVLTDSPVYAPSSPPIPAPPASKWADMFRPLREQFLAASQSGKFQHCHIRLAVPALGNLLHNPDRPTRGEWVRQCRQVCNCGSDLDPKEHDLSNERLFLTSGPLFGLANSVREFERLAEMAGSALPDDCKPALALYPLSSVQPSNHFDSKRAWCEFLAVCASTQFRFVLEGGERWDTVPTGFDRRPRHCYLSAHADPFLISAAVIDAEFLTDDLDAAQERYDANFRRVAALSVGICLTAAAGPVAVVAAGGKGNAPAHVDSPVSPVPTDSPVLPTVTPTIPAPQPVDAPDANEPPLVKAAREMGPCPDPRCRQPADYMRAANGADYVCDRCRSWVLTSNFVLFGLDHEGGHSTMTLTGGSSPNLKPRFRWTPVSSAEPATTPVGPAAPTSPGVGSTADGKGNTPADAPGAKPKKARGRRPADPALTKCIREAWSTGRFRSAEELVRELKTVGGKEITAEMVRRALDRSRKKSKP